MQRSSTQEKLIQLNSEIGRYIVVKTGGSAVANNNNFFFNKLIRTSNEKNTTF
jgi:hypothetical protein